MYPAILSYDEQASDNMSEESGKKKTLSLRNRCGLFEVEALLSRPKNMAASDPSRLPRKCLQTPDSEVAEDLLMKDIIK